MTKEFGKDTVFVTDNDRMSVERFFFIVKTLEQTNNIRSKGRKNCYRRLRKQTTRLIGIDDLFYHVFLAIAAFLSTLVNECSRIIIFMIDGYISTFNN